MRLRLPSISINWAGGSRGPRASSIQDAGVVFSGLDDPALAEHLRAGAVTASGATVNEDAALRVATAWRCVHLISGAVANFPADIYRRVSERERKVAIGEPLRGLLHRPNAWQTRQDFVRMLTAHALLHGNGFAIKVRSGARIIALWPVKPGRMKCRQLADMSLVYDYTRDNGSMITLPASEVFHLRGLTLSGVNGVGVIQHAREAMGLAIQTEHAGAKLFKHGVIGSQAVQTDNAMSDKAYDRLKASIEEHNAGAENAGKLLILEEGVKVADGLMTAADAQFLETRKLQRSEIGTFFGVPPHMLGDTEKATSWGSGIEQQSTAFVQYTLQDWITAWEGSWDRDLIGAAANGDSGLYMRLSTAGLLRGDIKARWAAYRIGREIEVLSANDVRAMEELNPRDGGDDYTNPVRGKSAEETGASDDPDQDPTEAS